METGSYDGDGGRIEGQRIRQAQGGEMVTKPEDYVSVNFIAQYFGIGLSTVYAMIEEGTLPAIYLPGRGGRKIVRVKYCDMLAMEDRSKFAPKPKLRKHEER